MEDTTTTPVHVEIDEDFMVQWLAHGYAKIDAYLGSWARFDAYCAERDAA